MTDGKRPMDPGVVDFVKALARANAARDIARLKERAENGPARDDLAARRAG